MAPARTALGLLFVATLGACADEGGTLLLVLHNKAPEEGCIVTATETGSYIPAGRIDAVGVVDSQNPTGYLITPLIKNLTDSQGGNLEAQRTIVLRGARVELVLENSAELGTDLSGLTTSFTAPFSGTVSPDGGLVATLFELVPGAVVERVEPFLHDDSGAPNKQALVTATFTVFGTMNDGNIEADPFMYPVTICYGCLNTFLGTCFGLPAGEYGAGGACNLYQDAPSQCCLTSTAPQQLLCPAVPESTGP